MTALHLDHISFSYTSALDVFDDLSVHIGQGWTGVVGANGSGKTTLLQLIEGSLLPDGGHIVTDPPRAHVVLVEQTVDRPGDAVGAFASSGDGVARRWMGTFGLTVDDFVRWETLSPGERKRWQLAAALSTEPDVLLLDEPTNHIDTTAREIVVDELRRFAGVGLVVSHDRDLLEGLTTRTLRIERGRARLWNGAYDTARAGWEAEEAATAEAHDKLRRTERATKRRLGDERRQAEQRSAARRREVRNAGVADSDARSVEAKGRHDAGATAGSRRMRGLRSQLERTRHELADIDMAREIGGSIFVDFAPSPKRTVVRHSGPLTAGDTTIAEHVDVGVDRTDRIRLTGPNGSGKSTLLAALLSDAADADRVLHLPQELDAPARRRMLEHLHALPGDERGQVLSIVALLGVDPDDLLVSDDPSPGEARKLTLALGLGTNRWCLLLDEPTNHFDLPAIERLESALDAYPGAMIVVTHDDHFAAATTTTHWHLEDGVLRI